MKLLTLIEIETKKIFPWLITLFTGLTALSTFMFYRSINQYKEDALPTIMNSSVETYVNEYGYFNLTTIFDFTSFIPLSYLFCAFLLIMLSFYLWYKEWFGTSKHIYMLLSLKGSRFSIFLSKLITIILSFFCFYGVIILNLAIGAGLMKIILPTGTVEEALLRPMLEQSALIDMILPLTINDFLYKVVFIILMFSIISFCVLCDRSKKFIGIIIGILYGIANMFMFFYTKSLPLFMDERIFVDYGFVVGMSIVSILLSAWLLNKKVSI